MAELAPEVKICGITRVSDAELAVELGAWALGMIFYAASPRGCARAQASLIANRLRRRVELCGVFVNAHLDDVCGLVDELGLSMVQLHGDEGPAFCAEVARRTGTRVIKAVQVGGAGDLRDLERFHVDYHLVDARGRAPATRELRGGTGETFDWSLLERRSAGVPLILSGGLEPGNVSEAVAVARPFAVDSASGTEAAPGIKDPHRLRAFFAAARAGSADLREGAAR